MKEKRAVLGSFSFVQRPGPSKGGRESIVPKAAGYFPLARRQCRGTFAPRMYSRD